MWVDITQTRADEMEKKIETQMEPKNWIGVLSWVHGLELMF